MLTDPENVELWLFQETQKFTEMLRQAEDNTACTRQDPKVLQLWARREELPSGENSTCLDYGEWQGVSGRYSQKR